jgi:hypothetical protein
MKPGFSVERLLRWRLRHAEAKASSPPDAARLIELARPWWEKWPEKFRPLAEALSRIEIVQSQSTAETIRGHDWHPVPTLIVRQDKASESFARILYFSVGDGKLRLNFQLEAILSPMEPILETTFISDTTMRPLFSATASAATASQYHIDTEFPAEFTQDWEPLKVTDRMPFRLILC